MTDIVERLRAMARAEHDDLSIADEAADQIERLREDLTTETNMRKDQDRRLEKAEAEIERLRGDLEAVKETNQKQYDEGYKHGRAAHHRERDTEMERLKMERDWQYDENVNRIAAEGAAILRAEAAEAEIASLQAALRIIPGRPTEEEHQWALDAVKSDEQTD